MTGRRDPMLAPLPLLQTDAHATEVVGGLSGTRGQIDWAELIRPRIHDEFNRVAAAFAAVAAVNPAEKAAMLSASISVAMNNTALGLGLAITLLLCHMYLETKTTELVDSLEVASIKFLNSITERRATVPQPTTASASARASEQLLGAARA